MADKNDVMDIEILKQGAIDTSESADTVQRIVVFGAGTMGRGISQLVASKGIDVILIERTKLAAKQGLEKLEQSIDDEIARWTMTESEKRAILSRITISDNIEDAVFGDIVIEAITENLDVKRELWAK